MRYEFLLLYPLNPKSVASYRGALRTSGAKDDPSDAELVLTWQTHVEFAAQSIVHSRWAAAYYQQQRKNGSGHQAAVRALAYKRDRIIFRCWKDRVPYDEAKYLESLKRSNSPLIQLLNLPKSSWTHCGDFDLKRRILQQLRTENKKKKEKK